MRNIKTCARGLVWLLLTRGACQLLQFGIAYQHKRASVVGQCALSFLNLWTYGPKTEKKHIEIIDVQEKRGELTHIACAIVLVFFVSAKADMHPLARPFYSTSNEDKIIFLPCKFSLCPRSTQMEPKVPPVLAGVLLQSYSSSIARSNLEIQSRFMLVFRSWASLRREAWRL